MELPFTDSEKFEFFLMKSMFTVKTIHGLSEIHTQIFETFYGQRSFSYRSVTVWNKLGTEIKMPLPWLLSRIC